MDPLKNPHLGGVRWDCQDSWRTWQTSGNQVFFSNVPISQLSTYSILLAASCACVDCILHFAFIYKRRPRRPSSSPSPSAEIAATHAFSSSPPSRNVCGVASHLRVRLLYTFMAKPNIWITYCRRMTPKQSLNVKRLTVSTKEKIAKKFSCFLLISQRASKHFSNNVMGRRAKEWEEAEICSTHVLVVYDTIWEGGRY